MKYIRFQMQGESFSNERENRKNKTTYVETRLVELKMLFQQKFLNFDWRKNIAWVHFQHIVLGQRKRVYLCQLGVGCHEHVFANCGQKPCETWGYLQI